MSWSDVEEAFSKCLPGYESRAPQRNLATAIETAFAKERHLMGQAGTGTGKSLAALVGAIDRAKEMGHPVAVSTATKALQDQYANKDLPFLQEVYREQLGVKFTFSVLKGRGNYVCQSKVAALVPDSVPNQQELLEEMAANPGMSGDFDELATQIDPRDRSRLASSSDECPGKNSCPFGESCFGVRAKERAQLSDIVVVNDSLLVMDARIRAGSRDSNGNPAARILPELSGVVIDEAHELEDYATSALGNAFSERGISAFATEVVNFVKAVDPNAQAVFGLHGSAKRLFEELDRRLAAAKVPSLTITANDILSLEDEIFFVMQGVQDAFSAIRNIAMPYGDDNLSMRRKRLIKRCEALRERLKSVMLADDSELVRWVAADEKRGTLLEFAPLHVGKFLKENIWDEMPAVFLSATLALGKDFSFIAGRIGLTEYDSFDAGTPFDYRKQSRMFVPENFTPVGAKVPEWQAKVTAVIPELVRAAGGRTLALFTSAAAMNRAHANTCRSLERMGLTVLKQGDLPTKALTQRFKEDETSVLFAMKTFMTGIDVQGDSLRLVIMDKLPYVHPDNVVFGARCDAIDQFASSFMQKSFMTLSVPAMALTLLQAVGRLIRTQDDEGMVAILDSRLMDPSKGFMRIVRNALPPSPHLSDLSEAVEYLQELRTRRG